MDKIRDDEKAVKRAVVMRAQLLGDWLRGTGAVVLWQQDVERVGRVEAWTVNARVFLLMHFARGDGFEVYIPASDSNRTAETLAAVSLYLNKGRT